jgi:hypothetical protein
MFNRKRSTLARLVAAVCALAVFGGAAIALADSGGGLPPTGAQPRPTGHHHAKKLSPAAAHKRAALVARKRREGHHRRTKARSAAVSSIGPGTTFADQGVTLSAASPSASSTASASSMPTSAAAVQGFQNLPAAQSVFGPTTLSDNPTATLLNVTEQDPIVSGVKVGVAYPAWVVSVSGPVEQVGTPADAPVAGGPSTDLMCKDVGIYDVQTNQWTELLQGC